MRRAAPPTTLLTCLTRLSNVHAPSRSPDHAADMPPSTRPLRSHRPPSVRLPPSLYVNSTLHVSRQLGGIQESPRGADGRGSPISHSSLAMWTLVGCVHPPRRHISQQCGRYM